MLKHYYVIYYQLYNTFKERFCAFFRFNNHLKKKIEIEIEMSYYTLGVVGICSKLAQN